jgi:hypothetical protein
VYDVGDDGTLGDFRSHRFDGIDQAFVEVPIPAG